MHILCIRDRSGTLPKTTFHGNSCQQHTNAELYIVVTVNKSMRQISPLKILSRRYGSKLLVIPTAPKVNPGVNVEPYRRK